jgi:hypothetical protein
MPAPYGGLNVRDDITALQPNEARLLINFKSGDGVAEMRDGLTAHATGIGSGNVETLMAFNGVTSNKMIAAANANWYDITSAGAGTSLKSGFSEDRWQWISYNDRLIAVNGTDAGQIYNGTTVTALSGLTGAPDTTGADFINIAVVRDRVWFIEKDAASAWYWAIGAIAGAVTEFDIGQIAEGGKLMAIGSWSRDGGDGPEDHTVFVMDTGELIIYQGDVSTTFTLVGRYSAPPPIGRRCLFNSGGELLVITELGVLPVSAAVAGVGLDLSRVNPWGKVAPALAAEAAMHGALDGWSGLEHKGFVYVNVPVAASLISKQYVLNLRTGGWSVFEGWNNQSLVSFNSELYVGALTGGVVPRVDGANDLGTNITLVARTAFVSPRGTSAGSNLYTAVRLRLLAEGEVSGSVGVDTDFFELGVSPAEFSIVSEIDTTPWGSDWGSPWGSEPKPQADWTGVNDGNGRNVSVKFRAIADARSVKWLASDILYKPGGIRG